MVEPDQPHVLRCMTEIRASLRFITEAPPDMTEQVDFTEGCNNVTLTWVNGTPARAVAAAVSPPEAVIAVWRFDAAAQRFVGFSPLLEAPSDLTAVNRLDAVLICLREPAVLVRPAIP